MSLDPIAFLAAFAGIQLLAAMSPGPAFAVLTRHSLEGGRRAGLAAAAGCAFGLGVWLIATMIGLTFLMTSFWWLYTVLRVLGGLFLLYLAFQLWSHARDPIAIEANLSESEKPLLDHFWAALLVQLSNPKALAYCASILATLLPPVQPLWMKISVPIVGTVVEGSWWIFVACVLSTGSFRRHYVALKSYFDRAIGAVLGLLGAKLLLER